MGQRTAIIVQHVDDEIGKKTTRVFFNQWGIGRIMPSNFMGILNATISCTFFRNDNYVNELIPNGCHDITDDYAEDERSMLDSLDFSNPENVGKIVKSACNNNGGIFVRITTETQLKDYAKKIEYAYMLGREEGGDYKKFCTEKEWMNKFKNYIDDDFMKLYDDTIRYFGAKEVCNFVGNNKS